jgi:hypothetical protein
MENSVIKLAFLVVALSSTIFGGLVLFSDKVLDGLQRTIWRQDETEKKIFTDRRAFIYNRYVTGLGSFLVGIFMLVLFFKSYM